MIARTASADDFDATQVHAALLFDMADPGLLPPPAESYALDLSDAAVQRVAVAASLFSVACAVGGLWLATLAG